MRVRARVLLAAATTLAALVVAPARAADPTVLVSSRYDGSLVRVTLVGRVATVEELVPGGGDIFHAPTQAIGTRIAYAIWNETRTGDRYDVGLADATTGDHRTVTADGHSGFLLVSPDGRFRYVMKTDREGFLVSLVRTDAAGRYPRTLVNKPRYSVAELSGAGLTGDGSTIYLAQTPATGTSTLFGVDTVSGATRPVRPNAPLGRVHNVVVSPDGRTLAVSYQAADDSVHVALVTVATGAVRELLTYGGQTASAFSRDGTAVVLSAPFVPVVLGPEPGLALADVATGVVTPIAGTGGLLQAVPVQ
ncbi:MAG TPA: hypothetical protein VGX28_11670 [Frankiaceae bacterium]|jgi:Tol biopolymer transport system component|nr:hypothetical protein [Frankiaceae bacterium]